MKMMKTTKPTSLPKITSVLTKSILPYLVKGKLHNMGHQGTEIMDVIKKVPQNLEKLLNIGIHKALNWFMSKMGQGGSGVNLPGGSWGSFWKGFKKGFVSVFKPGAKLLGTVASALGQPEIGIPLTIASGLM
jgi:hypothetical protein